MLPATTVARPAGAASAPVSAVTVDLAVRSGDREHLLLRRQRAREELDVADELGAARNRGRDRRLILGHARADRDQVGAGERRVVERARRRSDTSGNAGGELRRERRRRPRVRDAHAAHRAPARWRASEYPVSPRPSTTALRPA